jgi:hypothetical protein
MASLHNDVLDAALDYISSNANQVKVYDGSTLIKSDAIPSNLDASNFGAVGDNPGSASGGGRRMQCLVSNSSDMQNISSLSAGSSIDNIRIVDSADAELVVASVSSTNVGASDAINLGTFYVVLKDPT